MQRGKDAATLEALGTETVDEANDYGVKVPASTSLLLRIVRGLGIDRVQVGSTDARHALIREIAEQGR